MGTQSQIWLSLEQTRNKPDTLAAGPTVIEGLLWEYIITDIFHKRLTICFIKGTSLSKKFIDQTAKRPHVDHCSKIRGLGGVKEISILWRHVFGCPTR